MWWWWYKTHVFILNIHCSVDRRHMWRSIDEAIHIEYPKTVSKMETRAFLETDMLDDIVWCAIEIDTHQAATGNRIRERLFGIGVWWLVALSAHKFIGSNVNGMRNEIWRTRLTAHLADCALPFFAEPKINSRRFWLCERSFFARFIHPFLSFSSLEFIMIWLHLAFNQCNGRILWSLH